MSQEIRDVNDLTVSDLQRYSVWEYVLDEALYSETAVKPVNDIPVSDLDNRVIGTKVTLANGQCYWGILGNVSLNSSKRTLHFQFLSVESNGQWFHLSRYHDVDYETNGPVGLADFLNLSIDEVFPINYDISAVAKGLESIIKGAVHNEPIEKLTQEELIRLALDED